MGKYTNDAKELLQYVGGKENIAAVSHCVTRMRFVLNDPNKADISKISKVYDVPHHLTAPWDSSRAVGSIIYEIGGKKVGKCELFSKESIDKISVFGLFWRIVCAAVVEN